MKLLFSLTLLTFCPVLSAMQTTQDIQSTVLFTCQDIQPQSRIEKYQTLLVPNTTKTEYAINTANPALRHVVVKLATAAGKVHYAQRSDRLVGRGIIRQVSLPHNEFEIGITRALFDKAEYIFTLQQAKK